MGTEGKDLGSPPQSWIRAAEEAANSVARAMGIPNLTPEEAASFALLGRRDVKAMIGQPFGITAERYEAWKYTKQGPDLDFYIYLILGKHLKGDNFLQGV